MSERELFVESASCQRGSAGRPAIDPKILVALWLYATSSRALPTPSSSSRARTT